MGISLMELPTELLLTIISYLKGREVAELQRVCHHSKTLCRYGSVWRSLALRQFGSPLLALPLHHAEQFYKNILVKYGCLMGTWVRHDYPFGGLLDVKLMAGGKSVVGSTWRPHPDLGRPLKKTGLFEITCKDGHVKVRCIIDTNSVHDCEVTLQWGKQEELCQFRTVCQKPCEHRSSSYSSFSVNVWKRSLNES